MEVSNRIEIKTMCETEDLLTNEVKTYCLKTHFYFENITIYSEQKSSLNCEVSVLLQVRGTEVRDMRLRQLKENEESCRQLRHSSLLQEGQSPPRRVAALLHTG